GRGVEHSMIAKLAATAVDRKISWIEIPTKISKKNKPALSFLSEIAGACAKATTDGPSYRLAAKEYVNLKYTPKAETAAVFTTESAAPNPPVATNSALIAERLRRIALELNTSEAILHFVSKTKGEVESKSRPDLGVDFVEPATDLEKKINEIWRQALKIDQIGKHDNFFDLGGNSLLLAQVHRTLQNRFERKFPLIEMLRNPTVGKLAEFLAGKA